MEFNISSDSDSDDAVEVVPPSKVPGILSGTYFKLVKEDKCSNKYYAKCQFCPSTTLLSNQNTRENTRVLLKYSSTRT